MHGIRSLGILFKYQSINFFFLRGQHGWLNMIFFPSPHKRKDSIATPYEYSFKLFTQNNETPVNRGKEEWAAPPRCLVTFKPSPKRFIFQGGILPLTFDKYETDAFLFASTKRWLGRGKINTFPAGAAQRRENYTHVWNPSWRDPILLKGAGLEIMIAITFRKVVNSLTFLRLEGKMSQRKWKQEKEIALKALLSKMNRKW